MSVVVSRQGDGCSVDGSARDGARYFVECCWRYLDLAEIADTLSCHTDSTLGSGYIAGVEQLTVDGESGLAASSIRAPRQLGSLKDGHFECRAVVALCPLVISFGVVQLTGVGVDGQGILVDRIDVFSTFL